MRWTLESLRNRRGEILSTAERRGMRTVHVFGSISRGEAAETAMSTFSSSRSSLLGLGGFAADIEDLLGCRVDVVSERGSRPRFRDRVPSDAVTL